MNPLSLSLGGQEIIIHGYWYAWLNEYFWLIFIPTYIIILIIEGWLLQQTAKNLGIKDSWWGYIPVLNLKLYLRISNRPEDNWIKMLIPFLSLSESLAVYKGINRRLELKQYGTGSFFFNPFMRWIWWQQSCRLKK